MIVRENIVTRCRYGNCHLLAHRDMRPKHIAISPSRDITVNKRVMKVIKLTFVHFRCACMRACKILAQNNSINSQLMQRSLAKIKDVNIFVRSYILFDKHGFTMKIHNTICLSTMGNPFLTIIARRGMHLLKQ